MLSGHCVPGTADNQINQGEIDNSLPSSTTKSLSLSGSDIKRLLISNSHFSDNKENPIPLRGTPQVIITTPYINV